MTLEEVRRHLDQILGISTTLQESGKPPAQVLADLEDMIQGLASTVRAYAREEATR